MEIRSFDIKALETKVRLEVDILRFVYVLDSLFDPKDVNGALLVHKVGVISRVNFVGGRILVELDSLHALNFALLD